ncbi:hypothetical protein M422DRAFT_183245, partial [Sphaerobolus stellatus SS14]
MSLKYIPTELQEKIISMIDSPTDFLHLALTCRRVHDLVMPFHLEYREFYGDTISSSLWHCIAAQPNLARKFR